MAAEQDSGPSISKKHGNLYSIANTFDEDETDPKIPEMQLSLHCLQQSDEDLPSNQDESDQGEPNQAVPGLYGKETDTDRFGIPMLSSSKHHKMYRKALPKSLSTKPTQPLEYWTDPIRVKAIYAYRVDDPDSETFNFEAGEVLIVQEVDGKWWPAMTKSGRQGLIPSN